MVVARIANNSKARDGQVAREIVITINVVSGSNNRDSMLRVRVSFMLFLSLGPV